LKSQTLVKEFGEWWVLDILAGIHFQTVKESNGCSSHAGSNNSWMVVVRHGGTASEGDGTGDGNGDGTRYHDYQRQLCWMDVLSLEWMGCINVEELILDAIATSNKSRSFQTLAVEPMISCSEDGALAVAVVIQSQQEDEEGK
jgi:hypothetical protein